MAVAQPIQRITETDDDIRRALDDAFLPALIPALAQATGDLSLLRDDLRPPGMQPGVPQGGLTEAQQAAIKDVAFDVIKKHPRRRRHSRPVRWRAASSPSPSG